jgi:two-component system, NarL family, invasion response regulator UvrY
MMRILLVDDHPIVRHGIRQILVDGLKAVTVGEANDVAAASSLIRNEAWDIVVLDLTLPGASGLDLLKEIRRDRPALPVLVLSMHPAAQFARRVLAAGASGYLTKDSAPTELIQAIDEVRRGRLFVGSRLPDWARTPTDDVKSSPHEQLSDREYQVLRMLGSGRTVSEIATALRLSVKTVSTYRTRLLDKMQMHTNAEVMRYAIENGLMDS